MLDRHGLWIAAVALLLAGIVLPVACSKASPPEGGLDWEPYDEAIAQGDKPLMIHFTTSWCGWCRKLEAEVYTQPAVKELAKNFRCVQVDGDARGELVTQYGVTGYPAILFTDPQGNVKHRISGYLPAAPFQAQMEIGLQAASGD